jgi:hypothetical protein
MNHIARSNLIAKADNLMKLMNPRKRMYVLKESTLKSPKAKRKHWMKWLLMISIRERNEYYQLEGEEQGLHLFLAWFDWLGPTRSVFDLVLPTWNHLVDRSSGLPGLEVVRSPLLELWWLGVGGWWIRSSTIVTIVLVERDEDEAWHRVVAIVSGKSKLETYLEE